MHSQRQSPPRHQTTSGPYRAVVALGLFFACLAFSLCFLPAQTAETPTPNTDRLEEPARIFIPYDEQFQAVRDGYVWVPESFHHRLFDQIRGQNSDTDGWQLTEAFYEGSVNYDSFTQTCSLFHLNAVYTVILDTPRTTIRLPMMSLPPDGKFLFDREPIFPILRENEVLFEIEHSSPGKHRLEFSLMPPVLNTGGGNLSENDPGGASEAIGGEITIPRIPSSRLLLHLPPDAPPIRVNGALGTTEMGADTLLVQLGAVDRITIERGEEPGRVGHATIEAEQLFILRARSTQASLSARFRFRITGGKIQSLAFENDSRFFLSQCSCEEAELSPTVQRAGQQSDQFRVTFKKPVSGLITLRVDYVIRDFSGIGRIRLPKINAVQAKITRSWLALYEGPTVEFVHLPPGDVTPAAFQNLWSSEDPPLAVYDIIAARPNWVVSIRQRETSFCVSQHMNLAVEPAWTKISCTADISTEGELFRLPLAVPENLTIDSVSVLGERGESPDVSVRRAGSRVYLAFRNPIQGNYTVDIDGRLPTAIDQTEKFPTVSFLEGDQTQFALNIYRSAEVLVRLEGELPANSPPATGPQQTGGQSGEPPEGMIFVMGSAAPSAEFLSDLSLVVQRNLADFTCQTRQILYNHPSGDWGLFCDFAIEAQSGAIDHFDVDLDEYCGSDLVIEPDIPRKVTPMEKGIRVTLTPREPITKTFSFRLRTPVRYPTEAIRLPSVKLASPSPPEDKFRATVYLPIADAMKQIGYRWNHSHLHRLDGLNRTEGEPGGPASDRSGAISALAAAAFPAADREAMREIEEFPPIITQLCGLTQNDFYVYESTGSTYQATLSVGRKTAAVIVNESVFFVRSNGEIYGRTSLELRTGVSETYELRTAQHASILKLTLDSTPVTPRPIAPGRWQLTIPPGNNINHLEVLFLIPPDQSMRIWSSRSHYARLDLVPATFEKIPTARSFWTVVFESHTAADSAVCNISQIASDATANTPLPQTAPPRDENAYLPLNSPWKQPVFQSDAFAILSRFALERMRGQLDLLETASAELSPDAPQTRLWLARWLMNWDECCRSARSQISSQRAPHLFSSAQIKAIYESIAPDGSSGSWDSENSASPSGDDFREKRKIVSLPLREVTEQDYLALIERYRKLLTDTGLLELAESIPRGETTSPLSLWQINHTAANNQFLFGMTDKNIRSITIYRYNVVFQKAFRKMLLSAALFLGTLFFLILYLRVRSSGKRY
ncbi:MAG: hypothetical protein IIZ25_01635 [Thermoguttaceae bacterium]|nr:hypothetical protein [Thermoguttaceae bacterium]